jgi:hypothetical protein
MPLGRDTFSISGLGIRRMSKFSGKLQLVIHARRRRLARFRWTACGKTRFPAIMPYSADSWILGRTRMTKDVADMGRDPPK